MCRLYFDNKIERLRSGVRFVYHEYMITDRIGRHEVLLTINQKKLQFRGKKSNQVMKERELGAFFEPTTVAETIIFMIRDISRRLGTNLRRVDQTASIQWS